MANQFWTELSDQKAQDLTGGKGTQGEYVTGVLDELRNIGNFPPNPQNLGPDSDLTNPIRNFGVAVSGAAKAQNN